MTTRYYTVALRLGGALAAAAAVEWTVDPAPADSGLGWQPCLRLPDGRWRFASHDHLGGVTPHRREPGRLADVAIRYRQNAAGPWSAAAAVRKEIEISAEAAEGAGELPIEPGVVPAAPAIVRAPALLGSGVVGAEVTAEPGGWDGAPVPRLAFQWRRDGVPIPGAAALAYTPVPRDDLGRIDCVITARNVAGAAAATTASRPATCPPPRAAAALPEAVFDAGSGPQAVATASAFEGINLTFAATGADAAVDARTGVLTIPTNRLASRETVTVTATNSGGAAQATLRVTVASAASAAPRISAAHLADAISVDPITFGSTLNRGGANGFGGTASGSVAHCPVVVAYAAWLGDRESYGGRTPIARTIDQLRWWAANRVAFEGGGYASAPTISCAAAIAFGLRTPAVLDRLTAAEIARLKLALKGMMVGAVWINSVANHYRTNGGENRTIRGYSVWDNNPNFAVPPLLLPHVVAQAIGTREADAFLRSFDRAAFAAEIAGAFAPEIAAGQRVDLWDQFRWDWTEANQDRTLPARGPGPTKAQLETACRGFLDYRYRAGVLQPASVVRGEIERFFEKTIRVGIPPAAGQTEPWGRWNSRTGSWEGRIVDPSRWPGLPNQGRVGMAFELDAVDADGPRSSMGYVHRGLRPLLVGAATLVALGSVDYGDADFDEGVARATRGIGDIGYKISGQGYADYSHGGNGNVSNNSIFTMSGRGVEEKLDVLYALFEEVMLGYRSGRRT